jgi:hypothetical protein
MYTRSFDELEIDSPRGSTPRAASPSRLSTPRAQTVPIPSLPLSSEIVIETIGFRKISCRQLSYIIYRMGIQDPEMFTEGMRKPYGSTRVEVIISLYNQISDPVNLPCLLKHLTTHEKAVIILRLGWLNIWSPLRPNGVYRLRFQKREERQMIRLLIATSMLRTEEEWSQVRVVDLHGHATELTPNGDSAIPAEWHKEEGLPTEGFLYVEYTSGESETAILKLNEPLMTFVLPTFLQEDKQHKKREATGHSLFNLQNAGISLEFVAKPHK